MFRKNIIPGKPDSNMNRLVLIIFVLGVVFDTTGCSYVINKLAFHPDTETEILADYLPKNVHEIFINTEDDVTLHCFFIPSTSSEKILIYFHGNAGNINHRIFDLLQLSSFRINILAVSYRGYGKSQGKPSEDGIYIDGKAALNYVNKTLGFPMNNVIVFGRSIGTTVAINTSQNKNINRLILVTPLTNGEEFAEAIGFNFLSFIAGKSFDNIGKIVNVKCPILIIHGTQDHVIPFEMGERLYNEAKAKKEFVKIEGAGHNNLSTIFAETYWYSIYNFIMEKEKK